MLADAHDHTHMHVYAAIHMNDMTAVACMQVCYSL